MLYPTKECTFSSNSLQVRLFNKKNFSPFKINRLHYRNYKILVVPLQRLRQ